MFKMSDVAIIFATLLGPILAVQIQKWLEEYRAERDRRTKLFQVLMATRSALLSPAHVEALNAIPIEFYGKSDNLKDIVDAYKLYVDHHIERGIIFDVAWADKRQELHVDLLFKIANNLGYKFSRVQLKSEWYNPKYFAQVDDESNAIRAGMAKLLSGEIALPLDVKSFPNDEAAFEEQAEIRKLLLEWLKGQASLKIDTK